MWQSGFSVLRGVSSSNTTTGPYWIGDFDLVTVSILSSTTNPSRVTFQASNDDGLQTAIGAASWSFWTAQLAQGAYALSGPGAIPGGSPRWVRVWQDQQGSTTSNVTVVISGRAT